MIERKSHRILTGGLNLRSVGDKVAPGDSLVIENWRPDAGGSLVSRPGITLLDQLSGGSGNHTVARRGGMYYFGVANSLYRSTAPTTAISTALDGNPIGMTSYQGYMWIMNRSFQGKDNGSSLLAWSIAAPTSACTATAGTAGSQPAYGLTGTYEYFITYLDVWGNESNPSAASASVAPSQAFVNLTAIPTGGGSVTQRNIYRAGGSLGQGYLVGTLNDDTTTTFTDSMSDSTATTDGIALATNHDGPPAAKGVAGPYFGRLLAWSSAANVNRLWWTDPETPAFWPGSNLAAGNWVDVGDDAEEIVRVVIHARMAVIYKEHSIWRLIGDPDTGFLEQVNWKIGLIGYNAICTDGERDFFASGDGIYLFDLNNAMKISGEVEPIFRDRYYRLASGINVAPMDQSLRGLSAMEFAKGVLYFSFVEAGASYTIPSATLNYAVDSKQWGSMRTIISGTSFGYSAMLYQEPDLVGLQSGAAEYLNQEDHYTDLGGEIPLTWQSGYDDQGGPDVDKQYLELDVEFEVNTADAVTVAAYYDDGASGGVLGSLTSSSSGKQRKTFALDSASHKNISIRLECTALHAVIIHGVYVTYYALPRAVESLSMLPVDFGTGQVKEVKELQLDLDNPANVTAVVASDLPGNTMAAVATLTAGLSSTGRRKFQLPFGSDPGVLNWKLGRLWQLTLTSTSLFRFYSARLLMRVIGVFVEAYEATAGYKWDSQETDFAHMSNAQLGLGKSARRENSIKRSRELELEIEGGGNVYVTLISDLPATSGLDAQASRFTQAIAVTPGRKFVRLPVYGLSNSVIEGRTYRLQLGADNWLALYSAALEFLPVGQYLEASETAAGQVYDSREVDFGTQKVKEAVEIELDIDSTAAHLVVKSDMLNGTEGPMSQRFAADVTTSGRQKVNLSMTSMDGRLFQAILSGTAAIKLYGARLRMRPYGFFVDAAESTNGMVWDSTVVDLGVARDKVLDSIRMEVGGVSITYSLYTDLPGEAMTLRATATIARGDSRRGWITVPLPSGKEGRNVRLTIGGSGNAFQVYQAQIAARVVGRYLAAGVFDIYRTLETDFGSERVKLHKKLEVDYDCGGTLTLVLYTDQPGGVLQIAYTATLAATSGRQAVRVPLPGNIRGRIARVEISAASSSARIYHARTWCKLIGESQTTPWQWQDFPMEDSPALPEIVPLQVEPTPAAYDWAPLPVIETPSQWTWAAFPVAGTSDEWTWVDVPAGVS